ncbi:uncharacterized protein LOC133313981 [Gastrolobium bilobum]|uniref:uncharacterized protein LOC133313981 n=1 Tax=Gastrolobium bilobum TaxID=150636 RepID=UPI002AB303D5|nr:uncharacterized protein LOC133313981 [Gastrolobium bilobum]
MEEIATDDGDSDPLCPKYQYSQEMHKEICKQWKKALIVKLLGKRVGIKFFIARLDKMWSLKGAREFIDMKNGYLLVRFADEEDYTHVFQEGPWIIVGHYVIVQRWRPFFDPYDETFKKLAVWMRIPRLPIEFYTSHHLWQIGNLFGKTLKIDHNSIRTRSSGEEETTRAKFARICVEVDLRKGFLSKFKIAKHTFHVAYEGLHMICFACGRYGHRKDQCGGSIPNADQQPTPIMTHSVQKNIRQEVADEASAFGSWMIVQKPTRGRRARVSPEIVTQPTIIKTPTVTTTVSQSKQINANNSKSKSQAIIREEPLNKEKGNVTIALKKNEKSHQSQPMIGGSCFDALKTVTDGVEVEAVIQDGIEENCNKEGGVQNLVKELKNDNTRGRKTVSKEDPSVTRDLSQPTLTKKNNKNLRGTLSLALKAKSHIMKNTSSSRQQKLGSATGAGTKGFEAALILPPPNGGKAETTVEEGVPEDKPLDALDPMLQDKGSAKDAQMLGNTIVSGGSKMVFSWNCRGPGRKGFCPLVRDLISKFQIKVCCLLEPRISGQRATRVIRNLGLPSFFLHDAVGFSGSIWLLWDPSVVRLEIVQSHFQFIHTRISWIHEHKEEFITFVYGSPRRQERRQLWENLNQLRNTVTLPCMLMGDFNSYIHSSEKFGGGEPDWRSIQDFNDCLLSCSLADVGYQGPKFTWQLGRLQERLDMVVANDI